jgi:septum formation protein
VAQPQVEEAHIAGENPLDRALRLSLAKARAVAQRYPDAIVIGSDQVAAIGDSVLDKPGDAPTCTAQLAALSGKTAKFYTGCAVIRSSTRLELTHVDTTSVVFRAFTNAEVNRYVAAEQPFDCAGGFKVESLGISLFERVESEDPTALIGLPLIWLAAAFRKAGFAVP